MRSPTTPGSVVTPGWFLVGECLDFTGGCGGYNIHFAALSARHAAAAIARYLKQGAAGCRPHPLA